LLRPKGTMLLPCCMEKRWPCRFIRVPHMEPLMCSNKSNSDPFFKICAHPFSPFSESSVKRSAVRYSFLWFLRCVYECAKGKRQKAKGKRKIQSMHHDVYVQFSDRGCRFRTKEKKKRGKKHLLDCIHATFLKVLQFILQNLQRSWRWAELGGHHVRRPASAPLDRYVSPRVACWVLRVWWGGSRGGGIGEGVARDAPAAVAGG
jgi:hypothetical protein